MGRDLPSPVSDLESQTGQEVSGLEKALGKALKFNSVDLAANRNGDLGRNQRLRLLVGDAYCSCSSWFSPYPSLLRT